MTAGKTGESPALVAARHRADRLWRRMEFEVGLLTTRTGWMLSAQSFLFASFFLGVRSKADLGDFGPLIFLLPIIGLVMSLVTFLYMASAASILKPCREELLETKNLFPGELLDRVDSNAAALSARSIAVFLAYILVSAFMLFWLWAFGLLLDA